MQCIYQAAKANTNAEKTLFEYRQFITPGEQPVLSQKQLPMRLFKS
jgi:hypothetical protein